MLQAQQEEKQEQIHEITIYAMPTLHPIDWESPAKLYKTMYSCFRKTLFVRNNYLLGHLAVQIETPLLPEPILTAMTTVNKTDKAKLVFRKKIGFGVLGATIRGKLENPKDLSRNLKKYKKRHKLAFITYRINEQAARRIVDFIEKYSTSTEENQPQSNYYGGAFWPRYNNEGAGCSAFGMALLDLANLLGSESEEWLVKVKIPMQIIGGEFNENKRITKKTIYNTKQWYQGEGIANKDYVEFQIYDPSIIFQWILDNRNKDNTRFEPIEKESVPGLYINCEQVSIEDAEPLFGERPEYNLFIEKHLEKLQPVPIEKE